MPREFEILMQQIPSPGLSIKAYFQPPNSPDLNVLDLAVFPAIQAAYYKCPPKKYAELVVQVTKAFNELPCQKIDLAFYSLHAVMNEIISCGGSNDYDMPHLGKSKSIRTDDELGTFTVPVTCQYRNWL